MILYFHTNTPSYIRSKKIISSLISLGVDFRFFGACRSGTKWDDTKNCTDSNVHLPHGYKSIFGLFLYLIKAIRFLKKYRPSEIIVTNEELILIPLLAGYKGRIWLDAIDSLDIRVQSNSHVVKWFFRRLSILARKKANVVVEVEEFRRERFPQFLTKTRVLRNIIDAPSFDLNSLSRELQLDRPYVMVWGSLNADINGLEWLLKTVDELGVELSVVVVGIVNDSALLSTIESKPFVHFLGPQPHEECLKLLSSASMAYAMYKPVNENFRLAAPNKVYEALSVGTPILINKEALISQMVEGFSGGFAVPWGDVGALTVAIESCLLSTDKQSTVSASSFSWSSEFENVFREVLNENSFG